MAQDIRIMVPRVRRAIEGAGSTAVLTDEAIKDIIADSISSIILYTGSAFGKTITVTDRDDVTGAPTEYEVDPEVSLAEQTVIACQAALDFFFIQFRGVKTHETIQDEAQTWDYDMSPNLLRDQMKLLQTERDKALDALASVESLVAYESFLHVRDITTARYVESWVDGYGGVGGLQTDVRFG